MFSFIPLMVKMVLERYNYFLIKHMELYMIVSEVLSEHSRKYRKAMFLISPIVPWKQNISPQGRCWVQEKWAETNSTQPSLWMHMQLEKMIWGSACSTWSCQSQGAGLGGSGGRELREESFCHTQQGNSAWEKQAYHTVYSQCCKQVPEAWWHKREKKDA